MKVKILKNKAKCRKCNDIIESKHRHDFVTCKCGAISVDGGTDYIRRSAKDLNDIIELSEVQ
jgi:Zn finger protein HypA/HybF involved in hydrogenase expression